ncbi:MAG TPA: Cof-type HAD-IIB family hydrolase [Candidatus Faecalicoccus intestinipullorum]|nr:Cof-type HAD-IIB family hydrolase [Candidatus Faecalicoccus intestinipullorum]
MIKIAFFDVDGTLLPLKQLELNAPVLEALLQLQKNGVKLFLASGRPKFVLPKFKGIEFDGALSFNGQLCFDQERTLFENALHPQDVIQVFENSKRINKAVVACQPGRFASNYRDDVLMDYFQAASQRYELVDDFVGFLQEESIYEMMCAISPEEEYRLLDDTKNVQVVRWWPYACDLIPANGGKGIGVQEVLKAYGISKEEAISFGDGGNDIDMLQATGLSVAMGNALNSVKEIATYTTTTVEENGVVDALRHFGLI